MKKLITIILALIMTFFSAPQKGADQPHVTAEKPPQTAITVQVDQVPEESEMPAETAFVGEVTEAEKPRVELRTFMGGTRLLSMLEGAQLPRIC